MGPFEHRPFKARASSPLPRRAPGIALCRADLCPVQTALRRTPHRVGAPETRQLPGSAAAAPLGAALQPAFADQVGVLVVDASTAPGALIEANTFNHESTGSSRSVREARPGSRPVTTAGLSSQRHGRLKVRSAPASAAPNTSTSGWRCAMGVARFREASAAIRPAVRNGCPAHHASTGSITLPIPGIVLRRSMRSFANSAMPSLKTWPCGFVAGGCIAAHSRSRDSASRSTGLTDCSLHGAWRGRH